MSEPRSYCELWEELHMEGGEATGCDELFQGSAEWMSGEGDCPAPDWSERDLSLGFGDIANIDEELSGAAEDGATHFLSSSWAPDLGNGEMEQLFSGSPKQWLEEGSPVGSPAGQAVRGDYRIESLFWWETDAAPRD